MAPRAAADLARGVDLRPFPNSHRQRSPITLPHPLSPMSTRIFAIAAFVSALSFSATAAPAPQDFALRYHDLLSCIERTIGKGWQTRYDIEFLTNRWGALEPSAHDLDAAPQAIRITELRCRRELSLVGQPRP